ncbi:hypothetical protein T484DRAFT_1778948 [Baffinella frigidus]|nr:hypothetical protein T484DRAFT_1778948 [Cryptophyta sp. CCMP2293]
MHPSANRPADSPGAGVCRCYVHVLALLLITFTVAKEAGGEALGAAAVEGLTPGESQCCPLGKPVRELDCETLLEWLRCIGIASAHQSRAPGACLLDAGAVSSHSEAALEEAGLTHSEARRVAACRSLGTAGVVYVLWDLGKASRLVDLANSVSSIRRLEEGRNLGIVLFVAPASEGAANAQAAVWDAAAT